MILLKRTKAQFIRVIALCLILILSLPVTADATGNQTVSPYASYYLDAYNTYICDMGNGNFQIWYEVMGTDDMDEIGVLSIILYEVNSDGSLTRIKSFLYQDYDSMLAYDDYYHYSYVSFKGSSSKTYKAYVCIWAGKDGSGDTRYMWATE